MKRRLGKFGLIFLALALCLSITGAGFAAWTDTLTIEGTVNTGSVDLNVEYYSGTDIYKDLDTEQMVTVCWLNDPAGMEGWRLGDPPAHGILVASAKAEPGQADDTVVISFDNAFPVPLENFYQANIIVHYTGSVPAMVDAEITSGDQWLIDLWNAGNADVLGVWMDGTQVPPVPIGSIEEFPIQMHHCDYALAILRLHLPQDETLMNLSGSFTAVITATQWNEA